jgi:hypothetical protein
MAATSNKIAYASSSSLTASGLASLATSSGLVAGWSLAEVDNTSNLYLDYYITGSVMVGTTPTANTVIEVWAIPKKTDSSYFDTFDGTAKSVTVTSREMLFAYGKLLAPIAVPVATSNVGYNFGYYLGSVVGGGSPKKFQLWVVHNTGVNLNATGGNFSTDILGIYSTSGN